MTQTTEPGRTWPESIYVSNEKGTPLDSEIRDKATGAVVPGVYRITITRQEIEVEATREWPLTPLGPATPETEVRRYPLKRLEAESW